MDTTIGRVHQPEKATPAIMKGAVKVLATNGWHGGNPSICVGMSVGVRLCRTRLK